MAQGALMTDPFTLCFIVVVGALALYSEFLS